MPVVVQGVHHALSVHDGPGNQYYVPSYLMQGEQAQVDSYAPNSWLHMISPHVGYIFSGVPTDPNVQMLDVVVTPPASSPSGDTIKVRATTTINVRTGPGLSYPVKSEIPYNTDVMVMAHNNTMADGHNWFELASNLAWWIAGDLTRPSGSIAPVPPPQPAPAPPAPIPGTWAPPLNPALYGGHANPGGWSPEGAELATFRRNHINYALIAAFEANQQGAVPALTSAGVQHIIVRACVSGGANASDFARITLPILEQYAQALGGSNNMMIQLGNEANLVAEGWTKYWQSGRDFAIWWLNVAGIYRAALPGCKIGFTPMSPGGDAPGIRMDEETFLAGCGTAILSADWICVHNYWARLDGSDLSVPVARWRARFGNKPIVIGESGPPEVSPVVTVEAVRHAHALYSAAGIPAIFYIMDSSGDPRFSNAGWLQQGITV